MNLYEWEGKELLRKYGIKTPRGVLARSGEEAAAAYESLGMPQAVVKAQVLSGRRGKGGGIVFVDSPDEARSVAERLFSAEVCGQRATAVLVEERIAIEKEEYVSITYDTASRQPVLVTSKQGGMEIEAVADSAVRRRALDVRSEALREDGFFAEELWRLFLGEDARLTEINPIVRTHSGDWIAADAKIVLDDDAFFRHADRDFEPRTMMGRPPTEREVAVAKIDEGETYYRGTAGKYVELDGDVAVLFSGGGASISSMDALMQTGLRPANYTEYSGNPPRDKVAALARAVLSKPGLRGLWIAGGVANFTDIAETFAGIADALDEVRPKYPIVVRRAGPNEAVGRRFVEECAKRNGLRIKIFGKEVSMSETARVLADMVLEKS